MPGRKLKSKSITISIINNKGGVGKTTSTAILAELLSYLGKKTLLVDLDGQSNLSMQFQSYVEDTDAILQGAEEAAEKNIAELFRQRMRTREELEEIIRPTALKNVQIIPSSNRHKKTQNSLLLNQTGNNNIILKKALDTIKEGYDYILIDNAPASDVLTVNSMFASDYILIPVRLEKYSYKGLTETLSDISYIKEEHGIENPSLLGVFITQAEPNTRIYKKSNEKYTEELEDKFFRTSIRKDINIANMEEELQPILSLTPNCNAVFDYAELLLETGILDEKSREVLKNTIN